LSQYALFFMAADRQLATQDVLAGDSVGLTTYVPFWVCAIDPVLIAITAKTTSAAVSARVLPILFPPSFFRDLSCSRRPYGVEPRR